MKSLRRLGQSPIEISPIGLGCWQFSEGKGLVGAFWEALAPDLVTAIVERSLCGGINWFDTAEAYGGGRSEEVLGSTLRRVGKAVGDVVIATKWWPSFRTSCSIANTIDERLRRLGGFGIDLHQVHQPFGLSSVEAEMQAMADLVAAGKIRTVGVSNFSASRTRRAHAALASRGLPLVSNQMKYSLLDRRVETSGVLDACKELGVTLIAYSPLEQGLLSGKFHEDQALIKTRPGPRKWLPSFGTRGLKKSLPLIEELRAIAKAHGATPSQVALAWLLQFHGDTVVAIPGATKAHHVDDHVGAMALTLAPKELASLDERSRAFR